MKDLGIVTWHDRHNIGGNLQAFATSRILKKWGITYDFIGYIPSPAKRLISPLFTARKWYRRFFKNHPWILAPVPFPLFQHRYAYYRFQNRYFGRTVEVGNDTELARLNDEYRAFLCGSDQIWAPNVFHPFYFLGFVRDNIPKIAYAPSIGLPSIPEGIQNDYRRLLNRFDSLSVREQTGAEIVHQLTGRDVAVVLDPTFLLSHSEWKELSCPAQITHPYIFCYFLGRKKAHRKIVSEFAARTQLTVVSLSEFTEDKNLGKRYLPFTSHKKFLGYIDGAKYVFTDSFHGTALSILLEKDFYALKRFDDSEALCQNSRLVHILNSLKLTDRLLPDDAAVGAESSVDYKLSRPFLESARDKSLDYLKKSLENGLGRKLRGECHA